MSRLFDDEFLKKLEYLYVLSKKLFAGKNKAETRSKKIGWGMEFADYRDYAPGDDPRYLDWNLYARVGHLATKLFHEEENLNVYFLLDASRSMTFGRPSKFDYARQIVAALAYISLANLDLAAIQPFGDELLPELPLTRGKGQILKIFEYLEGLPSAPRTDMGKCFKAFANRTKAKGLLVAVSDFWDEAGYERALKTAYAAGFDLAAVCLRDDEEADPQWRGAATMIDSETGQRLQATVSGRTLKKYRDEYEKYQERLRAVCHALRCDYLDARTSAPFEDMILNVFRQGHFIK